MPGSPGLKGEPGPPGPQGRDGPTGHAGIQGVCDPSDCKAPDSWANQLRKYANQVFGPKPTPYSKGPPPGPQPAFEQPESSRRLPDVSCLDYPLYSHVQYLHRV